MLFPSIRGESSLSMVNNSRVTETCADNQVNIHQKLISRFKEILQKPKVTWSNWK